MVRKALINYGIVEPGENPFIRLPAGSSIAQTVRSAASHAESTGDIDSDDDAISVLGGGSNQWC